MDQSRRCQFCFGSQTLVAEWAYLAAGRTELATMVLDVQCKWCMGTGRMPKRQVPPGSRRPSG
jgi:hypothetical protein